MESSAGAGGDSRPEITREEQVAYILAHAREASILRGCRKVDLLYVDAVLGLYYASLMERLGAVEVPREDEWIPDAVGDPAIDGEEEARFVLERLRELHGVSPDRRRRLTRRLVEAILDCRSNSWPPRGSPSRGTPKGATGPNADFCRSLALHV